jgi:uncharacterized membrane protein AbrB (regulator of aidB expression)
MTFPVHIDIGQYSNRSRWLMGIGWIIILVKCVVVAWAIDHWQMPFHAAWIIGPTLVFAALASLLWLTHARE